MNMVISSAEAIDANYIIAKLNKYTNEFSKAGPSLRSAQSVSSRQSNQTITGSLVNAGETITD